MTQSKTINMKFINKRLLFALLFITSTTVFAQPKKQKVDGVVAVVVIMLYWIPISIWITLH